jgi:hypothetical protein
MRADGICGGTIQKQDHMTTDVLIVTGAGTAAGASGGSLAGEPTVELATGET